MENWIVICSLQILANCIQFLRLEFRVKHLSEWRIFWCLSFEFYWGSCFYSELISFSMNFNLELFICDYFIICKFEKSLNGFFLILTLFNFMSITLNSSAGIENFRIFLALSKSNRFQSASPKSRNSLRLVLIDVQIFSKLMMGIYLLLDWMSWGNFGNFMDKWGSENIKLSLNLSHLFIHLLIKFFFLFFKLMYSCPCKFQWLIFLHNFIINSF